jgi:hypothetical protein
MISMTSKSITILVAHGTCLGGAQVDYQGSLSKFDEHFRSRLRDDESWYFALASRLVSFHHSQRALARRLARNHVWSLSNQLNLTTLTG